MLRIGSRLPWALRIQRLNFSTSGDDPLKYRNVALMAHIDSGKTTLTESMLHASSYLATPGSVDTGSTVTDFLPAERERGITIQSASIPVHWKQWIFNLIDTPGHADFGMEVESASRIVDGAVVLMDAVEGVEAQTVGVWSQLNRHNVPTRMVFINKLDRAGASLHDSITSILSHRLHPKPLLLSVPIASFNASIYKRGEPGIEGLVDLIKWQVWRWDTGSGSSSCLPLPIDEKNIGDVANFSENHPVVPFLRQARSQLIDSISELSPEMLDEFLSLEAKDPYIEFPAEKILPHLRELTLSNKVLPVLCGSAVKHIGTDLLMNYIGELAASPVDIKADSVFDESGPLQVLAWKVGWDKQKGWLTYVRVYSGTLSRSSVLFNPVTNQRERITKLLLLYASEQKEVDTLPLGSVGVILGLKHTRTGDTLFSGQQASKRSQLHMASLKSISPPPATMSASIQAKTQSDLDEVRRALVSLERTDPSVRWTQEEGQTLVHGLGELHLEIVEGRLKDEFGAPCSLGKRQVSYRETFADIEEHRDSLQWTREIAGKPATALVDISVRKLHDEEQGEEGWGGNSVVNGVDGSTVSPSAFDIGATDVNLITLAQGLHGPLSASPFSGLPLIRTRVTIHEYSLGPGSPPAVLGSAAAVLLRQIIQNAGEGLLLEPYIRLTVRVPETSMGKVVKDITEHDGEIQDLLVDATSLSATAVDTEETTPFPSQGLFIPPTWLTPAAVQAQSSGEAFGQRRTVHAVAPLSKMLNYTTRLRAVSGGQASHEMSVLGFREVGEARKQSILQELGRR